MKKQSLIHVLNGLPREFSLDDLMGKLIVLEKIEVGKKDLRNGHVISHEKVKKEVKKWLR